MRRMLAGAAVLILFCSCDPGTGIVTPVLPYNPVDEGWKAVENFRYAMESQDIDLLEETLGEEFGLALMEEDWDDYDGDGIVDTTLNETVFIQTISILFDSYEVIELNLEGSGETVWPGDPSGETMQYQRSYDIKAWSWVGGQQEGWRRQGDTSFLCRADGTGIWHVTGIVDTTEE